MNRFQTKLDQLLNKEMISLTYTDGAWSGALISRKKDELSITNELESVDRILEVLETNDDVPITISINDQGILWVLNDEPFSNEDALEQFEIEVPNASIDDFFICHQENVLAFARWSLVSELIKPFSDYSDRVVHLSLAPVSAVQLVALSDHGESDVIIGKFSYSVEGGEIKTILESPESGVIELDGESLSSNQALQVGVALDFISGRLESLGAQSHQENGEMLNYGKLLTKAKMPSLVFLLLLFLINGVLYFRLSEKNAKLLEESATQRVLDAKLTTLTEYLEENKDLYERSIQSEQLSILADRIGAMVPSKIKLSRLVFFPEDQRIENRGAFIRDRLIIEGFSSSGESFSKWIALLEKSDWLIEIENQKYEQSDKKNASFQLIIKLHVEES